MTRVPIIWWKRCMKGQHDVSNNNALSKIGRLMNDFNFWVFNLRWFHECLSWGSFITFHCVHVYIVYMAGSNVFIVSFSKFKKKVYVAATFYANLFSCEIEKFYSYQNDYRKFISRQSKWFLMKNKMKLMFWTGLKRRVLN